MHKTTTAGVFAAGIVVPEPISSAATPASSEALFPNKVGAAGVLDGLPRVHKPGRLAVAWKRFFHRHPYFYDGLLAAVIYLLTVLSLLAADRLGHAPTPPAWVWIASGAACAALLFRRRYPWAVLAGTAVTFIGMQAVTHDDPLLILGVVTSLVTITLAGWRRAAITAAAAVTLLTIIIGTLTDAEYWSHPRPLAVAALCALSIAAADAVRNRRAFVAAVEDRARRAEESRDREAERRVGEERLRIARELHDVLAHHIAVINVQAGVAGHLLGQQPDQAREALGHVQDAARSVLSEMQAVVTVLREPDETAGPTEPAPGIAQIDDLIERFRGLGLTIDTVVGGAPVPLPPTVDLIAYRVIQESLTNVGKHAPGTRVEITFDYQPETLKMRVSNSPAVAGTPAASATGGFGLIGMRERVGSVGGRLRAERRPDGGFVTAVALPLRR